MQKRTLGALGAALVILASSFAANAGAAQRTAPTNLRLTPGAATLTASWGVTSTKGLTGFRLRWRAAPAGAAAGRWSPPMEVSAATRQLAIHGLSHQPYEVKLHAELSSGAGGTIDATGTPLSSEVPQEEPPAKTGVLFVSSGGSDSGVCSQVAPCRSLARAYVVAKGGETVQVGEGSYGDSGLPLTSGKSAASPVVFEPAPGASVRFSKLFNVEARGVELKDFKFERELYFGETAESDVARDNALHNFEIIANGTKAPSKISIIGGTAGPVADSSDNENNLIATNGPETTAVPTKITIEGVLIHEYTKVGSAHVDCLQIWAGNELLISGNTFKRCAVFDIFLQSLPNGQAGTPKNVTIQNNFMEKTIEGFYSVFLPRHNEGNQEHFENVDIRNNSVTQGISADPRASYTNVKFDGNIAPSVVFWNEATEVNQAQPAGVESDYNVFYGSGAKKIGAHDQLTAAGFISESTMNLNLAAGSAAIKHGNPNDFPTTDINGNTRPTPPDAGAAQYTG